MKYLLFLTSALFMLGVGAVQAEPSPKNYTLEQIKKMPRFSNIENRRCPKHINHSFKKRLECKHKVRIEIYEKRQARRAKKET